ncbi:MAG: KilA-N domain-containing protein [Desulfurellales bacterium]|nr:MAG: KilA-N domain-containing protein [Desulfurellales bacterium]
MRNGTRSNLVKLNYNDLAVSFNETGWFNATQAAEKFGKEPFDWLRQRDTVEYIAALSEYHQGNSDFLPELNKINDLPGESAASRAKLLRLVKKTGLVLTRAGAPETGGGTWMHPDLAVAFARWLDIRFSIWCDQQIKALIKGTHTHYDWERARSEAASSFKVMNAVLQLVRQDKGQPTVSQHFSNEARLVNWALTGEFQGLDRESLSGCDLALLARLEERNAVLIGCGMNYADRKPLLERFAVESRPKLMLVT